MYRVVFRRVNENRRFEIRLNGIREVIRWLAEQEGRLKEIYIDREDV